MSKRLAELLREVAAGAPAITRAARVAEASMLIKMIVTACKEEAKKAAEQGYYSTWYRCAPPYVAGIAYDEILGSIVSGLMIEGFRASATIEVKHRSNQQELVMNIDWAKEQ